MTSNLNITIRSMPVQAVSDWDVASVSSALNEHENGDFAASTALLDAFGRDDRISACLDKRTGALAAKRGLPFEVLPSDRDGRRSTTHAKAVQEIWWDVHGEATLKRVQRDFIGLGAAVGWLSWTKVGGNLQPKLNTLSAANLRWDAWKGAWVYRTLDGDLPITPGDGNWFLYTAGGSDDPWMSGAVRALGFPFVMRGFTWRDWARWSERHGLPLLLAKIPPGSKNKDDAQTFLRSLSRLGKEAVVQCPQGVGDAPGYGVDLLEAKDTAFLGFQALLERIDLCTAVLLLGQNLTTEVQAGAYASSVVHKQIEGGILSGDAESLSTVLRDQVWKPWARLNYGDAELAPWGTWDTAPPEDRKGTAETLKVAGEALTLFIAQGVPVDVEAYAERFSLELRKGGRVPEPEAPLPGQLPLPPPSPVLPTEPPAPPVTPPTATSLSTRGVPTGLHNGQAFADDMVARATGLGARALAPDVAAVLAAIGDASTYDEVQTRLRVAFKEMDPARFARLTEKAMVLSRVAGRVAALEDI